MCDNKTPIVIGRMAKLEDKGPKWIQISRSKPQMLFTYSNYFKYSFQTSLHISQIKPSNQCFILVSNG